MVKSLATLCFITIRKNLPKFAPNLRILPRIVREFFFQQLIWHRIRFDENFFDFFHIEEFQRLNFEFYDSDDLDYQTSFLEFLPKISGENILEIRFENFVKIQK